MPGEGTRFLFAAVPHTPKPAGRFRGEKGDSRRVDEPCRLGFAPETFLRRTLSYMSRVRWGSSDHH